MDKQIEIYQSSDGQTQVEVRFERDTLWLTQAQMAELFDKDRDTIGLHLKNIYESNELQIEATTEDSSVVRREGNRQVRRKLRFYNLDAIISVGYRVNSKKGTQFRIWATQRLKEYLVQGYAINRARFDKNASELEQALTLIKKAARSPELSGEAGRGLVDIVSRYTQTFLWLQRYDEGLLEEPSGERGGQLPDEAEAMRSLGSLKAQLMERGEATELFARPRGDGLGAILGNLDQSVFGDPAYPTVESKAAHLLYFIVKNHPFADGNKRSGAFLFVDFLHRNRRLFNSQGDPVINDTGLAALALLVAESDPKQKETLIRLIMNMLSQG
ncbi:virulence protein RhuM/Fic/DOC family protein [Alloalcanivorax xenomutans]|uniref:virulence protein RhuM/Fic/DOC family protein n=1 Tax=Alloalcanivorax xenomutans TaxID=1094342 RepID=UPI0029351361|nr:virulence protein RhuM/Fic/DOC family protein [Alloalcanivorax xenomutans]WOD27093.1 virulence protein RhuM/Fic/DOC family protein [Alloalcanivorax xenomutans]